MSRVREYGYYDSQPRESEPRERDGSRRGFHWFVAGVATIFVVSLAVVIGQRLSDQAISILAGAVCGVGASIPTSLLIVWVTRRREGERQALPPQPMAGVYPPVIVVQPPAQMGAGQPQAGGYLPPGQAQYGPVQYGPPATREFTVVGDGMERQHGQSHW